MTEIKSPAAPSRGFLSRVSCSSGGSQDWRLSTPYEQHRTLWRLFPDHSQRHFLFREQVSKRRITGWPRQFIIVSTHRPQAVPGFVVDTREFEPRLEPGEFLRFSAKLSITTSLRVERPGSPGAPLRGRGKTVDPIAEAISGIADIDERRAVRKRWLVGDMVDTGTRRDAPLLVSKWLGPRLLRHGFDVLHDATHVVSYEAAMHQGRKARDTITFSVADFQGVARVVDPVLAVAAALGGVGRGKALGYGLLLLSRHAATKAPTSITLTESEADEEEVPA